MAELFDEELVTTTISFILYYVSWYSSHRLREARVSSAVQRRSSPQRYQTPPYVQLPICGDKAAHGSQPVNLPTAR